jgi:anti-sigma regulatory factor (Ser/Thr protein kinase)
MARLLEVAIKAGPDAARHARRFVSDIPGLGKGIREDIVLLVSELVTNSYRYAGVKPSDQITLTIGTRGRVLRAEVGDPGRGNTNPVAGPPSAEGGWGLQIVGKKAARWGVEATQSGTIVWFEIDVPK